MVFSIYRNESELLCFLLGLGFSVSVLLLVIGNGRRQLAYRSKQGSLQFHAGLIDATFPFLFSHLMFLP